MEDAHDKHLDDAGSPSENIDAHAENTEILSPQPEISRINNLTVLAPIENCNNNEEDDCCSSSCYTGSTNSSPCDSIDADDNNDPARPRFYSAAPCVTQSPVSAIFEGKRRRQVTARHLAKRAAVLEFFLPAKKKTRLVRFICFTLFFLLIAFFINLTVVSVGLYMASYSGFYPEILDLSGLNNPWRYSDDSCKNSTIVDPLVRIPLYLKGMILSPSFSAVYLPYLRVRLYLPSWSTTKPVFQHEFHDWTLQDSNKDTILELSSNIELDMRHSLSNLFISPEQAEYPRSGFSVRIAIDYEIDLGIFWLPIRFSGTYIPKDYVISSPFSGNSNQSTFWTPFTLHQFSIAEDIEEKKVALELTTEFPNDWKYLKFSLPSFRFNLSASPRRLDPNNQHVPLSDTTIGCLSISSFEFQRELLSVPVNFQLKLAESSMEVMYNFFTFDEHRIKFLLDEPLSEAEPFFLKEWILAHDGIIFDYFPALATPLINETEDTNYVSNGLHRLFITDRDLYPAASSAKEENLYTKMNKDLPIVVFDFKSFDEEGIFQKKLALEFEILIKRDIMSRCFPLRQFLITGTLPSLAIVIDGRTSRKETFTEIAHISFTSLTRVFTDSMSDPNLNNLEEYIGYSSKLSFESRESLFAFISHYYLEPTISINTHKIDHLWIEMIFRGNSEYSLLSHFLSFLEYQVDFLNDSCRLFLLDHLLYSTESLQQSNTIDIRSKGSEKSIQNELHVKLVPFMQKLDLLFSLNIQPGISADLDTKQSAESIQRKIHLSDVRHQWKSCWIFVSWSNFSCASTIRNISKLEEYSLEAWHVLFSLPKNHFEVGLFDLYQGLSFLYSIRMHDISFQLSLFLKERNAFDAAASLGKFFKDSFHIRSLPLDVNIGLGTSEISTFQLSILTESNSMDINEEPKKHTGMNLTHYLKQINVIFNEWNPSFGGYVNLAIIPHICESLTLLRNVSIPSFLPSHLSLSYKIFLPSITLPLCQSLSTDENDANIFQPFVTIVSLPTCFSGQIILDNFHHLDSNEKPVKLSEQLSFEYINPDLVDIILTNTDISSGQDVMHAGFSFLLTPIPFLDSRIDFRTLNDIFAFSPDDPEISISDDWDDLDDWKKFSYLSRQPWLSDFSLLNQISVIFFNNFVIDTQRKSDGQSGMNELFNGIYRNNTLNGDSFDYLSSQNTYSEFSLNMDHSSDRYSSKIAFDINIPREFILESIDRAFFTLEIPKMSFQLAYKRNALLDKNIDTIKFQADSDSEKQSHSRGGSLIEKKLEFHLFPMTLVLLQAPQSQWILRFMNEKLGFYVNIDLFPDSPLQSERGDFYDARPYSTALFKDIWDEHRHYLMAKDYSSWYEKYGKHFQFAVTSNMGQRNTHVPINIPDEKILNEKTDPSVKGSEKAKPYPRSEANVYGKRESNKIYLMEHSKLLRDKFHDFFSQMQKADSHKYSERKLFGIERYQSEEKYQEYFQRHFLYETFRLFFHKLFCNPEQQKESKSSTPFSIPKEYLAILRFTRAKNSHLYWPCIIPTMCPVISDPRKIKPPIFHLEIDWNPLLSFLFNAEDDTKSPSDIPKEECNNNGDIDVSFSKRIKYLTECVSKLCGRRCSFAFKVHNPDPFNFNLVITGRKFFNLTIHPFLLSCSSSTNTPSTGITTFDVMLTDHYADIAEFFRPMFITSDFPRTPPTYEFPSPHIISPSVHFRASRGITRLLYFPIIMPMLYSLHAEQKKLRILVSNAETLEDSDDVDLSSILFTLFIPEVATPPSEGKGKDFDVAGTEHDSLKISMPIPFFQSIPFLRVQLSDPETASFSIQIFHSGTPVITIETSHWEFYPGEIPFVLNVTVKIDKEFDPLAINTDPIARQKEIDLRTAYDFMIRNFLVQTLDLSAILSFGNLLNLETVGIVLAEAYTQPDFVIIQPGIPFSLTESSPYVEFGLMHEFVSRYPFFMKYYLFHLLISVNIPLMRHEDVLNKLLQQETLQDKPEEADQNQEKSPALSFLVDKVHAENPCISKQNLKERIACVCEKLYNGYPFLTIPPGTPESPSSSTMFMKFVPTAHLDEFPHHFSKLAAYVSASTLHRNTHGDLSICMSIKGTGVAGIQKREQDTPFICDTEFTMPFAHDAAADPCGSAIACRPSEFIPMTEMPFFYFDRTKRSRKSVYLIKDHTISIGENQWLLSQIPIYLDYSFECSFQLSLDLPYLNSLADTPYRGAFKISFGNQISNSCKIDTYLSNVAFHISLDGPTTTLLCLIDGQSLPFHPTENRFRSEVFPENYFFPVISSNTLGRNNATNNSKHIEKIVWEEAPFIQWTFLYLSNLKRFLITATHPMTGIELYSFFSIPLSDVLKPVSPSIFVVSPVTDKNRRDSFLEGYGFMEFSSDVLSWSLKNLSLGYIPPNSKYSRLLFSDYNSADLFATQFYYVQCRDNCKNLLRNAMHIFNVQFRCQYESNPAYDCLKQASSDKAPIGSQDIIFVSLLDELYDSTYLNTAILPFLFTAARPGLYSVFAEFTLKKVAYRKEELGTFAYRNNSLFSLLRQDNFTDDEETNDIDAASAEDSIILRSKWKLDTFIGKIYIRASHT